jgi:lysophospholipase L1-like esterase
MRSGRSYGRVLVAAALLSVLGAGAWGQHSAVTAVPRADEWWVKRQAAKVEEIMQGTAELAFLGDSITQGWEGAGKAVWEAYYGDRKAINLGFSGDQTQHLLWRVDNSSFGHLKLKLSVIMIGTNNCRSNSASEIVDGIRAVVEHVRLQHPFAHVLLLGVFPRADVDQETQEKLRAVNREIAHLDDGQWVHFRDIGAVFLEEDGSLSKKVMPDLLHLNAESYGRWAHAIEPFVAEFLGEIDAGKAPRGFSALWNGKDLSGWKGLVENPEKRAGMSPEELAAKQKEADELMNAHWLVQDGVLYFDGKGSHLCTKRLYEDFEMIADWKIAPDGDSGIYLRGSPQVQIWDTKNWPQGSGGLYNNKIGPADPLVVADRPIGEWNRFYIRMVGDKVTVYLNNRLVVDNVVLENYWDRSKPIYPVEQIELQAHGHPVWWRNLYVRELPRGGGWKALFNGKDLSGWEVVSEKKESAGTWGVEAGLLFTSGEGGGWLSTTEEYGDFELELEFRVPAGGNSGVFIRAPREGNPAYQGSEIQVLDDYDAQYAELKPWQYCGSVYATCAPTRRVTLNAGEWQKMRITAVGPRVKVNLNGYDINDCDLSAHPDKEQEHPGLKRTQGYIGLQNHGTRLEYRNLRIRDLSAK